MPRSKKPAEGRKPPQAPRQPSRKKAAPKESEPYREEENFEHTLRRLVIARDGLGRS
ncbi:MAG: hypothetical protein R3234_02445 [Thermoanaerobaculia bacterium]|nr:hypothetical protein [Thermoanaerobaculia bacterium]